ncbi:MAG TPA: DUF3667 domain-containing protein, partial [Ferruginibacter sp.]|nr:DUF3667 domain-containing protein [Ferruginibacter sp.]
VEPAESLWHLVTHFFNDITHFDGKFFSTLRLLLIKPGFLSTEYKMGRRNSYLNPVKMYVFTSFVFFLVFFSAYTPEKDIIQTSISVNNINDLTDLDEASYEKFKNDLQGMNEGVFNSMVNKVYQPAKLTKTGFVQFADSVRASYFSNAKKLQLKKIAMLGEEELKKLNAITDGMDSVEFASFTRSINDDSIMTRSEYRQFIDSARQNNFSLLTFGKKYNSRKEYDSLAKAGLVKDNWMMRKIRNKGFEIKEKYGADQSGLLTKTFEILAHNFPQLLFVSLPLFALLLKLLYIRRKEFYLVSHSIYSVHLYIFYLIVLLVLIFLDKTKDYTHWLWLRTIAGVLLTSTLVYEYKAMRNFYGQRRAKTIFKFLLVLFFRFIILLTLLVLFFFLSILKV